MISRGFGANEQCGFTQMKTSICVLSSSLSLLVLTFVTLSLSLSLVISPHFRYSLSLSLSLSLSPSRCPSGMHASKLSVTIMLIAAAAITRRDSTLSLPFTPRNHSLSLSLSVGGVRWSIDKDLQMRRTLPATLINRSLLIRPDHLHGDIIADARPRDRETAGPP